MRQSSRATGRHPPPTPAPWLASGKCTTEATWASPQPEDLLQLTDATFWGLAEGEVISGSPAFLLFGLVVLAFFYLPWGGVGKGTSQSICTMRPQLQPRPV